MRKEFALLLIIPFLMFGCAMKKLAVTDYVNKSIDIKLCGSWSGSEKGQQDSMLDKYWIQQRFPNGEYLMIYTAIIDGEDVEQFAEKGKWWIEDGMFYESPFPVSTSLTSKYIYEIMENGDVKFKAKLLPNSFENKQYEFTEKKLKDR